MPANRGSGVQQKCRCRVSHTPTHPIRRCSLSYLSLGELLLQTGRGDGSSLGLGAGFQCRSARRRHHRSPRLCWW